jgi:hypothetical protein
MCISLLCPALNHSLFLENDSLRPHSYSKQLKLAGKLDVSHRVLKIRPIFNSSMASNALRNIKRVISLYKLYGIFASYEFIKLM